MKTAVITLKIEPTVKSKVKKLASELGISLSAIITAYLKEMIRTKTINFTLSSEELRRRVLED